MTDFIKVPLEEASNEQLRWYAGTKLGIEDIRKGQQNAFLIGKIMAIDPDCKEIDIPDDLAKDPAAVQTPAAVPARSKDASENKKHFQNDPRVTVNVMRTSDPTKAKRVFVNVQGDVIEIQRGEDVAIPLRHFFALENAREKVGRDSGEVDPASGMAIMVFEDQDSYPFSVKKMPPQEEIDAWMELHSSPPAIAA